MENNIIEIFKDIPGYEGKYQASNLGKIKSLGNNAKRSEKILKASLEGSGYEFVNLYKNTERTSLKIHRLVAITFISNPENKKTVNHINGNKLDNNVNNLEWSTYSENLRHAFKIGLNSGIHKSKLKQSEVLQIKDLLKLKRFSHKEIGKFYGVAHNTISYISSGKNWKHI
jgi:hypothetical protein